MGNIADALTQAILIVFLLIITILVFTILIDYLRFLWGRHKVKKETLKILREAENKEIKVSEEDNKKFIELIDKIMKENGVDIHQDCQEEETEENE